MKLKDTFVTQEMDGEQVMVEAGGGFAGMVRSNQTAAFIIDQLKTETTKEAILDAMEKKYDVVLCQEKVQIKCNQFSLFM